MPTRGQIETAFLASCRAELKAFKPGNVHAFASGHGMTVADFEASAVAAAPSLCQTGARVGRRILDTVKATKRAVGQNTNLGIVLLCAPLAHAAEHDAGSLADSLEAILLGLDREDAALAFEAITLASPGGLGSAPRHDVREPPSCTLREAMCEAAERDRIAKAYCTGFAEVFEFGLAALRSRPRWNLSWWGATAAYLGFLRSGPDSHILRKHGPDAAERVRGEAESVSEAIEASSSEDEAVTLLTEFDTSLKARGLNPGTCADLAVATLFAASLQRILREAPDSGSLAPGEAGASLLSGQPVRRVAGR